MVQFISFPIVFIGFTILVIQTAGFTLNGMWYLINLSLVYHMKIRVLFDFETVEGNLRIHKPQQNLYIDGGPGSGKSESWIKGIIYQCAERNYAGFVYDWEGDPSKPGSPILSRIAYGSIEYFKRKMYLHQPLLS